MIISIAPELLGNDLDDFLLKKLGEGYEKIVIFVSIIALIVHTYLTSNKSLFKTNKLSLKELEKEEIPILKEELIDVYNARLNSKLTNRYPIELQLKYSLKGTKQDKSILDNANIDSIYTENGIFDLFKRHKGRVLLVGEPGSGKTTLILQLALKLLEEKQVAIPLIIELNSWSSRFVKVEDWFNEYLPLIGIDRRIADILVKENLIIPLFDGLDELIERDRKSCLEAIKKYAKIKNLQYVISSRIEEYSGTVDAPVYCQLEVRPLSIQVIKKSLELKNSPESRGLYSAILKDKILANAIQTPFYFNISQFLFSSMKTLDEFNFKEKNILGRQNELVDYFILEIYEEVSCNVDEMEHWLSYIAYQLNKHQINSFELQSFKYSWGNFTKTQLVIFGVIHDIIKDLPLLLVAGLFLINLDKIFPSDAQWFFEVLFLSFFVSLILGSFTSSTLSLVGSSNSTIRSTWNKLGLFTGVKNYLDGLSNGNRELIEIVTTDNTKWPKWDFFFSIGKKSFAISIGAGLVSAFLQYGTTPTNVNFIFEMGYKAFLFVFMLFLIILFVYLYFNPASTPFIKLKSPYQRFISSLYRANFSIFQHFFLRYLLFIKGYIPFKLVPFLNKLSKKHLLEKNGGIWRFRHRILQEYFAKIWKENEG